MRNAICAIVATGVLSLGAVVAAAAQAPAASGGGEPLATVRITQPVFAGGKPLPAGTYELRVSSERPTPLPGQSAEAQRFVEFVSNGTVVAREIAEVLRDEDLTPVGTSSIPGARGTRVEMLKGGEFLRVSVTRGGDRFLVHLPVAP